MTAAAVAFWPRLLALVAASTVTACAVSPQHGVGDLASAVQVPATPFYPQERFQCGPAALMTVLDYSGVDTSLDELVERVYLPARQGSLQAELIAATRAYERVPYVLDASLAAIVAELQQQRPVLVLQNLGTSWFPRWHYAVVYAVDPVEKVVRLRSGLDKERETPIPVFLKTWQRAGFWSMTALAPDQLPANPDRERYFSAIAALEETGHLQAAQLGWQAAAQHWPDTTTPLFGLANTAFSLGDPGAAELSYRAVLRLDSSHWGARNNLAYVLAASGHVSEALGELDAALAEPDLSPTWRDELQDTRLEILSMQAGSD